MKGFLSFALLLLVAVAFVQSQDQETFATICKDQFETCATDRNCCRGMVCRQSPVVDKMRCVGVLEMNPGKCAKNGDFCRNSTDCCLTNKCVFGRCR